ncbi:hypothetical protein GR243_39750, partial [Rhizobium leguminosarum]|nr:hypothetical protein [Rhizobium leguminosarum]
MADEEDYSGQAPQMVGGFGRDGFPASPDEYHAFTHTDRARISASAALEADPAASGLPREQAVIAPATDQTTAGGRYPQPDAHLRQPLPSDAEDEVPLAALLDALLQMDEAALQSFLPPLHPVAGQPSDIIMEELPQPLWEESLAMADEEDYSGQAPQMVGGFGRDGFPASPDEYHAFTHTDRARISASAALEADPAASGLPREQAVIAPATDQTTAGGRYPQPDAHLRQPLPSDAEDEVPLAALLDALLQMDEAALQSFLPPLHPDAGPDDSTAAVDGGATETAENYEQAVIQSASDEDMKLDPSDEKMGGGPDLDKIAATTPRQGRRKGPWADALKKANPDLSAKDAARIVDAATNII